MDSLVAALKEKESSLKRLQGERERLAAQAKATPLDGASLKRECAKKLQDVKGLIREKPEEGRALLRALLTGRLIFEPHPKGGFEFRGRGNLSAWLTDVVGSEPAGGKAAAPPF